MAAGMHVGQSPLAHTSLEDVRRQLEVNVVGQVAVTQARTTPQRPATRMRCNCCLASWFEVARLRSGRRTAAWWVGLRLPGCAQAGAVMKLICRHACPW